MRKYFLFKNVHKLYCKSNDKKTCQTSSFSNKLSFFAHLSSSTKTKSNFNFFKKKMKTNGCNHYFSFKIIEKALS